MGHCRPQRQEAGQAAAAAAAGDQPRRLQPPHAPRRHHHPEHDVHRLPQDGHLQGTTMDPRRAGWGQEGTMRGEGLRSE